MKFLPIRKSAEDRPKDLYIIGPTGAKDEYSSIFDELNTDALPLTSMIFPERKVGQPPLFFVLTNMFRGVGEEEARLARLALARAMTYYNLPPTKFANEFNDFEKSLRALPADGAIKGLDLLETITRNTAQNPKEENSLAQIYLASGKEKSTTTHEVLQTQSAHISSFIAIKLINQGVSCANMLLSGHFRS
eukprot:s5607_g2.t1